MESWRYLIEHLYYLTEVPVYVWNIDTEQCILARCLCEEASLMKDEGYIKTLVAKMLINGMPYIEIEDDTFYYALCKCTDSNVAFFGPALSAEVSKHTKADYIKRHQLTIKPEKITFSIKAPGYLTNLVKVVYERYSGEQVTDQEIINNHTLNEKVVLTEYENLRYKMENVEAGKENLSYLYTRYIQDCISSGDVEKLREKPVSMLDEHMGIVAKNAKKQQEYMMVTGICIYTQAAIAGGMPPAEAYELSDLFLQKLEMCTSMKDIFQVGNEASIRFAERVKERRDHRSNYAYVEQCKAYVARHINKTFNLSEIADYLKIDKNYLSRIFSKKEGMCLQEYVHRERIKAATNMLKYSDVSISRIAEYLCFNSQSHFGAVFKKYQGITPLKYREQNQISDYNSISSLDFKQDNNLIKKIRI